MLRAGIREKPRFTIARFQSGINFDIMDKVELIPYNDLNDLVQLCIMVENQLNRKISFRKYYPYSSIPIEIFKKIALIKLSHKKKRG